MIKIAIVEDNLHYRSALVKLLQNSELFLLKGVYATAEDAITGLFTDEPDITLIDIQLPKMSGITLIQKVRYQLPKTQFLICTLHQDNQNIFEALRAGASGYILKSTPADEIKNAIKELYMGGAPMSPYIARKIIGLFHQGTPNFDSYGLSDRELEVLELMSNGLLYKQIADRLFISSNTVKNHLKSIYKKLHVHNKIEAINKYQAK